MSKIGIYAILIIVGIFAAWLLLRNCGKIGPDHSMDKKVVDSIVEKALRDSIAGKKHVDYLTDSLAQERHKNDSLSSLQHQSEEKVHEAGNKIAMQIAVINALKEKKDTIGELNACDSLKNLYEGAAKIVGGFEYLSDSLITRLKLERGLSDSTKNYIWSMFSSANQNLFEVSRKYGNLYADYQKLNKKPKRFGIGPELTVSIVNGNVKIVPGIGAHYSLIKF